MRQLLSLAVLLFMCITPSFAQEWSFPQVDEVYDWAQDYGVSEEDELGSGMQSIVSAGLEQMQTLVKRSVASGMRMLAVVLLCGLAESMMPSGKREGLQVVELAGALAVTMLTVSDMEVMIGLGRETIEKMDQFSNLLLPTIATLTAATGGVTGAAVRQGVTVLCSNLLMGAIDRILVPLVYVYVAACSGYAALGNEGLKKLAELIKGGVTVLLTVGLLGFVGYLTASGAIAGSVDAAAIKAAKITISRTIPVVGGILADAAETMLAGAGMLRGTVGVVGVLVVVSICFAPFLQLAIHYLTYKGTAALTGTVANSRISTLMEQIGSAFGLILGMTGSCALILLISLVSAVSAVIPT